MKADPEHCYNSSVFLEFLWFCEVFPGRREEAVNAIRSGCYYVSPFLNNTLYGWQSVESQRRSLWHARQLERELEQDLFLVGQHIELPSASWCAAEVLAACGMRWMIVPYLAYEGVFEAIHVPPVFEWESPSGRRLRTVMDRFASVNAGYWQGKDICQEPQSLQKWKQEKQGSTDVLVAGMHSDTHIDTFQQVGAVAEQVIQADTFDPEVEVRRSTYASYARAVDGIGADLPTVRGDFGCSWEGWLVSLAQLAADARQVERDMLYAEALLAGESLRDPSLTEWARSRRNRLYWLHAMLADHAWNGSDLESRIENHRLRRGWVSEIRSGIDAIFARIGNAEKPAEPPTDPPPAWLKPEQAVLRYDRDGETHRVSLVTHPEGSLAGLAYRAQWQKGGRLSLSVHRPAGSHSDRALLVLPSPSDGMELIVETGGAIVRPDVDLLPGAERKWFAMQHWSGWVHSNGARWIASADAFLWRLDLGGIQLFGNDINPNEVSLDQAGENEMCFRFAFRDVGPTATIAEGLQWARETIDPLPKWPIQVDAKRASVCSVTVADEGPPGSVLLILWESAGVTGDLEVSAPGWSECTPVDLMERPLGPTLSAPFRLPLRAMEVSAWRFSP
jgi:hypothetical protein